MSLTLILFHGPLCELVPPHLVNIYSNINLVNITSLWDLNNDHEVCMETMIVTNKQNMLLSDQYIVFGFFFYKMWTVRIYMHRKINSKTKIKWCKKKKKKQWHNCRFSKENIKNSHCLQIFMKEICCHLTSNFSRKCSTLCFSSPTTGGISPFSTKTFFSNISIL